MPIIESPFSPLIKSGQLQTILASTLRFPCSKPFTRHLIELDDGDFVEYDSYVAPASNNQTLVILTHGLEGSSKAVYIRSLTNKLLEIGHDVIAWNMRGCSGQPNRKSSSYHSGMTSDLASVIEHVIHSYTYSKILLVGFSVGGNITLKYLGEKAAAIDKRIIAAATYSVPVDLASSAAQLALKKNRLYMSIFLKSLRKKLYQKALLFPEQINLEGITKIRSFKEFDTRYIAPFFNFSSAEDYWKKASALPFLEKIQIPTLLINSSDDSFLSPASFPITIAEKSSYLTLEISKFGGHVGFLNFLPWQGGTLIEERTIEFFNSILSTYGR